MKKLMSNLYMIWVIGTKDIGDALKNKFARVNIILMIGMVVFFYWLGTLRPFDHDVRVVVYDQGQTSLALEEVTLADGAGYSFREADSLEDMQRRMAHQKLGLVLPSDFDQLRGAGALISLEGYIFWADRFQVDDLEIQYSQAFSEILDQPVQIVIGENIIIPAADVGGMHNTITHQLVYFVFWTALGLIPSLMLEEKQTKTLDALLVSPASPLQIVLGKALAGFFYVLLIGGLSVTLNWTYIVHWEGVLFAFLGYALLAIGLALVLGSFASSMRQVQVWSLVLILAMIIPPMFQMESNLKSGMREVLSWFPSSAVASLFRFGCAQGVSAGQIWTNLAVALATIAAVFGLVIWKVRRSDR